MQDSTNVKEDKTFSNNVCKYMQLCMCLNWAINPPPPKKKRKGFELSNRGKKPRMLLHVFSIYLNTLRPSVILRGWAAELVVGILSNILQCAGDNSAAGHWHKSCENRLSVKLQSEALWKQNNKNTNLKTWLTSPVREMCVTSRKWNVTNNAGFG